MTLYNLVESDQPPIIIGGGGLLDPQKFETDAHEAGHTTEELRKVTLGGRVLAETVELLPNPDN